MLVARDAMLSLPSSQHASGVWLACGGQVWKFLLGYYPWDSTYAERRALDEAKREEYFIYKRQWEVGGTPGHPHHLPFATSVSGVTEVGGPVVQFNLVPSSQ